MPGLRERQKADRHRRILAAATTLFRQEGYRQVRIEDLAQQADVSVGTVYNYYATKGDILIAIVAMEVEEVLAAGEALLADPPAKIEVALARLIDHYYEHSLHYLNKEMWRAAMAISIEAPLTANGAKYNALDARLRHQVQALIKILQRTGKVDTSIDPHIVGCMIFNILNMLFIEFVKHDDMSMESLKTHLHQQIQVTATCLSPFR